MLRTRESPLNPKSCTPRIKEHTLLHPTPQHPNSCPYTLHPYTRIHAPTPYSPKYELVPLHPTILHPNLCPYTIHPFTRSHTPTPYTPTPERMPLHLIPLHPNACPYTSYLYTRAHAPTPHTPTPELMPLLPTQRALHLTPPVNERGGETSHGSIIEFNLPSLHGDFPRSPHLRQPLYTMLGGMLCS